MTEALENKDIVQVSVYLVIEQENLQRILPENQLFHYRPEKLQTKCLSHRNQKKSCLSANSMTERNLILGSFLLFYALVLIFFFFFFFFFFFCCLHPMCVFIVLVKFG